MVELLYATGLRVSELVNLEDAVILTWKWGSLQATGKRDKQRIVPDRPDKARESGGSEYLQSARPRPMSKSERPTASFLHPARSSHDPAVFLEHPQGSCGSSRDHQAYFTPHASAFVCHPFIGSWGGSPVGSNDVGPCQHRHHANLHPCRAYSPQKSPRHLLPQKTT